MDYKYGVWVMYGQSKINRLIKLFRTVLKNKPRKLLDDVWEEFERRYKYGV